MYSNPNEKRYLNVGVCLAKIFAIFLVVLCHYVQTVRNNPNILVEYTDILNNFRINLFTLDKFILYFFRCLGHLGNFIFIACSVWYLSDSNKTSTKKTIKIFLDVFLISALFLLIYSVAYKNIPSEYIIKSLLPNSYGNNWFCTAYILIYAVHTLLNNGLEKLSKNNHLKLALSLFAIYYIFDSISGEDFYYLNHLTNWLVIYICIVYIKKYMLDYCDDLKKQVLLLFVSLLCLLTLHFIKFFIIEFKPELYNLNNPFIFGMGLSIFNIFRKINIKNNKAKVLIQQISNMSLYCYLIHENILFRNLSRVKIVYWMFDKLGINFIVLKVIAIAFIIFIISIVLSSIYELTFSKVVSKISDFLTNTFDRLINKLI